MESKIVVTVMPVLELSMQPNDKVFAESGELSWMSMAIQMQTGTSVGGQQGGFMGALGRAMAGGTLFMTEYTAVGGPGLLAFAAKLPGQIVPLDIAPGHALRVHPGQVGMFQESVQFNIVTVPGIQNMFFGGSGLFLAALTGPGRVWLQSMSMQHLAHAIAGYLPKAG